MSEDISEGLYNIAANYSDADDVIVIPNKVDTVVIDDDSVRREDPGSASGVDNARGFYPSNRDRQPVNWMSMPPPNRGFRGRGYGQPGQRGRGHYRGRGGQRYGGPGYDNPLSNWVPPPMHLPPPRLVPPHQLTMAGPPPMSCPPPMQPQMSLVPYGPVPTMAPPTMAPPQMAPAPFGQPPPYNASVFTQNMPPPEIWVETKTAEGASYYYHARTRQTTWDRPPESAVCRIFTYEQCESMAENGDLPDVLKDLILQTPAMNRVSDSGDAAPAPVPAMFSVPPPTWPMQAMQPTQPMQAQLRVTNEEQQISNMFNAPEIPAQFTQPPPWNRLNGLSLDGGYQSDRVSPRSSEEMSAVPGPTFAQPPNGVSARGGGGAWDAWGSWATPSSADTPQKHAQHDVAQLPQLHNTPTHTSPPQTRVYPDRGSHPDRVTSQPDRTTQPAASPPASQPDVERPKFIPIRMPPPRRKRTTISEELKQEAAQWTRHTSPAGRSYYYNEAEKTSVWLKPDVLRKFDELTKKMKIEAEEEERFREIIIEIPTVIDLDAEETTPTEPQVPPVESQKPEEKIEENDQVHVDIAPEEMAAEVEVETTEENERLQPDTEQDSETIEQVQVSQEPEATPIQTEQEKPAPAPSIEESTEKEESDKDREKEREKEDDEKKKKCNLPMWITHVAGTPWSAKHKLCDPSQRRTTQKRQVYYKTRDYFGRHVVWTAEGTMFFFNPTRTPSSVWARPAELQARDDVEAIINFPPDAIVKARTKHALAKASTNNSSNGDLKRSARSDSDSSDNEELSKKVKVIEEKKQVKKQDPAPTTTPITVTPSEENSANMKKEFSIYGDIPPAQRVSVFRQMLADCQVSAFTSYEKELPKIVNDKRHLLLSGEQRRREFDKYVKEKLQSELQEPGAAALLQKKNDFVQLMDAAMLHSKSSFLEFSATHGSDPRFLAVDRPRSREMYFTEYLIQLKRKEREERESRRDQAKFEFNSLLREHGVDRHSRWLDVKRRIEDDPRYRAVESSAVREDYFKDFTRSLKVKDDRRKEKDKEKNGKKEKEKKDKKIKKVNEKSGTEEKQPTPPPEQWADIIGIPENRRRQAQAKKPTELQRRLIEDKNLPLIKRRVSFSIPQEEPQPEILSPKRLRSSRFPSPAVQVKPRVTKTAIKIMDRRKNRTNGELSPSVRAATRKKKTEKE
ncbi:transcription elongation regulator 1 isoform X2 [Plutella xylostella]|uniref:transcription elongation regulator 1 isoform X2 n=1 Tax=Plutella xylostella TaxID=51655 RepID=UPI002032EC7E|nr:transcription elongation regulator 1 isoform X2 [Plutella xylostella]